jgi:hypothetical protein
LRLLAIYEHKTVNIYISVYARVGLISGYEQRVMLPDDKQTAGNKSQHKQNIRYRSQSFKMNLAVGL